MFTLIVFLLILSILVLIHEFGHYTVAKRSGVLVEEFGLGIPPRLFGKKIGETLYSFNLLPFGGFVRLFGEDIEEDSAEMRTNPRSFLAKSPGTRAVILCAGVFMNLVLALTMYLTLFLFTGFKSLNLPVFFDYQFKYGQVSVVGTVISGFSDGSPAEIAELQVGEAIESINGVAVANLDDVKGIVAPLPNQEVTLILKDMRRHTQETTRTVNLTTTQDEDGKGILGVYISKSATIYYKNKIMAPLQHSLNMLSYTGSTFKQFIKMAFETKSVAPVSTGVAGPVGIYSIVESIIAYGGVDAVLGILDFVALLSLSLAFINILPLPALDGGRLIFVIYEKITGKPISIKQEAKVHRWGMLVLFGLLILVTIKDIRQLISL